MLDASVETVIRICRHDFWGALAGAIFFLGASTALCLMVRRFNTRRPSRRVTASRAVNLDHPLLQWTPHDAFSVRHLLNGGVLILGGPGSGKSSGSGAALSNAIIANRDSCGLILAAKPEDADDFRRRFARAGRANDLREFSPSGKLRMNFLDEVYRASGGSTHEIVQSLLIIGETLRSGGGQQSRGEDAGFWKAQNQMVFHHAVQILKLARGRVTAPELQRFIVNAATSPEQLQSAEWQAGEHHRCIKAAYHARDVSPADRHDFEQAASFWLSQWPQYSERTRSSILASVLGILHVFNSGVIRELISGETNFSWNDILRGQWLLVNMPPSAWGEAGTLVNVGAKYLFQKRILQRQARSGDRFAVIWCDEAQHFF